MCCNPKYYLTEYIQPFMTLETDVTRIPGFAEPVRLVAALAKLSRNPTHDSSPSSFPPPLPTSPPPISSRLKGYSASCPILTPAHPTCPTHPAPPYPPYLASGLLSQSSPPFLSSCFFSSLFPSFLHFYQILPCSLLQPAWAGCPVWAR